MGARALTLRLAEPGFETRLAKSRIIAGNERLLAYGDTVVTRLWISNNLTRILPRGQTSPNEFIETKLFRSPDFNSAIHW